MLKLTLTKINKCCVSAVEPYCKVLPFILFF